MARREWDELNMDCLVQIFARVGTESLVRFIPLVCKSWHHATFDPQCWRTLTFPYIFDSGRFVKYATSRSQRSATAAVFEPDFYFYLPKNPSIIEVKSATLEDLLCIAERCPLLKTLILPNHVIRDHSLLLSKLIGDWKNLEYFQICGMFQLEQILESISLHCNNFVGYVCNCTAMGEEHVSAIAKFTPKVKFLRMWYCWLPHESLVILLKGCTALETLDVRFCVGFEEDDDEIMKLASNINSFNCSGARVAEEGEDCYDYDYEPDTDRNHLFW